MKGREKLKDNITYQRMLGLGSGVCVGLTGVSSNGPKSPPSAALLVVQCSYLR